MPPPTRREQLELDELLSDIYRGIETLPDKSYPQYNNNNSSSTQAASYYHTSPLSSSQQPKLVSSSSKTLERPGGERDLLYSRAYVREYELPASSPLVKQHKQELAALRDQHKQQQPQRSTLKRHTTPDQQQPQSLASFVTSTTPENRRRVRIVDHPDKLAKSPADDDEQVKYLNNSKSKQQPVKYVNTNKLIYHQEQDPEDRLIYAEQNSNNGAGSNIISAVEQEDDDDEDIDGVPRVEYYHTTWLDRQLGRASKRRSSKELNERQVKEKAMIEELKRSLKNGAITLRQSFKGKGKHNSSSGSGSKNKYSPSETYDDQILTQKRNTNSKNNSHSASSRSVFGSGLATIPRNYHHNNSNNSDQKSKQRAKQEQSQMRNFNNNSNYYQSSTNKSNTLATPKQTVASEFSQFDSVYRPVAAEQEDYFNSYISNNNQQPQQQQVSSQIKSPQATNYSQTLPHNYSSQQPSVSSSQPHQLLQSHYRGAINANSFNTPSSNNISQTARRPIEASAGNQYSSNTTGRSPNANSMRNNMFSPNNCGLNEANGQVKSPTGGAEFGQQNTISSIPSASEVVRSALSRSSSQVNLSQSLNKTISLLPSSPPPLIRGSGAASPMTPTQQLKPASPSLSPSPVGGHQPASKYPQCPPQQPQRTATLNPSQRQANSPTAAANQGSKTLGPASPSSRLQQSQQQQSVYANPHASLMQQRMQQTQGRNAASVREFNELDSLLRSLSPAASSVHIRPGYDSKPAQASFGYGGYLPQQTQQPQAPAAGNRNPADIYASVQKQQQQSPGYQGSQQQPFAGAGAASGQPFTIDVSDKREEAGACLREAQNLSEFEPPVELLPSMEDYQNIAKLNPVKNHYWYKPNMSRDRAISLLKDKPQGTFIVRDSTSFRGAYGLAVKVAKLPKHIMRNPNADPSAELIRHFLIEPTANGVRLKGYDNEPVFSSLPNLIYQHSLTELALPCRLLIPRADIEDQKFNMKQKQFHDEFVLSKEQAKHQPYERTSPNGGYRKYPGDVYVHNEHRIIFE